ncbi:MULTISPECIES: GNAT family N-acetyltransferase [Psychrilyobacter]|uniref:GNAT family N-acetyltransferase n=1 Tax=Psychrilyobacter piezotolerans TaxID=2293438 RepID=A0ABX9KEU3_9FUSO|nr:MULTISPECIES: GNAT family N-acetyltransferase [Psychrilyobacter]MCS5421960.1 GNAT family N-acetyltransferase [Psychrilyobacter sp. S5]NDI78845.1 GNAT family N-acetyltransferase [Psychrilyobacter piezotolerans]RDE59445.1 GNAT family N-acetyltransferase [Psychrilyobacter sp. S5]REI39915.1 GNAT family N-acetyltransferase [Psychrilyobacter piezotolerans]
MRIEKLDEKHLKECSVMYIETFNSEPWNDKWDEVTSYLRLKDIYDTPGFFGLVVLDGVELKGAVFGNIEQWFEGYMYNLKEMFVKKDNKGSGIGTRLISELERLLKEEGVNSINLFTSRGDLTEKFYIKNGFITEENMIMMHKSI